ncbi:hemoglobin cathodic subunit beta-like [Seriola lalandi dorsalis]|uniref:Hemoglobin, beta adult 2 n=1 Tax=Seriola lalandi dorsalis TaxID=1841481 RepID=A0A3B4XL11_SERLL|nr:hemoglobin cathodic subunit beta-like [Seriola lalandi dorsalis]XP_056257028.1 hemoglobin cathodic subunit beta-like [Seriola aureovittata]
MVKWTDKERSTVQDVWGKVNIDEVGPEALARVLIVYPWTERYFGRFGDIFNATAVLNNAKVAAHGKVVLKELDTAVKNMDNIRGAYAALSRLHYEKLQVDPDTFRLLADCITITIACKLKSALDPQAQATWQKFLSAVVEAMSSQYD